MSRKAEIIRIQQRRIVFNTPLAHSLNPTQYMGKSATIREGYRQSPTPLSYPTASDKTREAAKTGKKGTRRNSHTSAIHPTMANMNHGTSISKKPERATAEQIADVKVQQLIENPDCKKNTTLPAGNSPLGRSNKPDRKMNTGM